jgi:hypothetical protein
MAAITAKIAVDAFDNDARDGWRGQTAATEGQAEDMVVSIRDEKNPESRGGGSEP